MSFDLADTFDLLERTPGVLDRLLRGTSPAWHAVRVEGPETFSAYDVVGHLLHGEDTDWVTRARLLREHGEWRTFEPFERFAQASRFAGWSLDALLDRFAERRRENLATVRAWRLTESDLDRRGRHPELGTVDLRQLLATWVAHDLGHLAQIARVLAKRHTADVGPWRAYLSVLKG